jgi:CRP/FNR family cyclic AMP-dependent transcriptional regulator
VVQLRAGKPIFLKGDPGHSMMAVLSGTVKIMATSSEGQEIVLNMISEGGLFGELALLDGGERSADASAVTDCQLLCIERREFEHYLRRNIDVALKLLVIMAQRLRRTTEQVEDLVFLDLAGRLARWLVQRAEQSHIELRNGAEITLDASQRTLGNLFGVSRESVNRQLSQWSSKGIIELREKTLVVRDAARLLRLADGYSG